MKLAITNNQIIEEFYKDKIFIGINFPFHFTEFLTEVHHNLGLVFFMEESLKIKVSVSDKEKSLPTLFDSNMVMSKVEHFVFSCFDSIRQVQYYIYQNKCNSSYLVPNLKTVDYLWMIQGANNPLYLAQDKVNDLKKIENLVTCQILNSKDFKNKTLLIF